MNLNSILLGSENPQRLADYYNKLFGDGFDDGGYTGWRLGDGMLSVGPHDQVHGKNAHPGRIIWNIESEDVKTDFERFKAAGATVIREPYEPDAGPEGTGSGFWIATFADPDENYFQLMSPFPEQSQMG